MRRRGFLKLMALATLPLAGVSLGRADRAEIELTLDGEPMTERIAVDFQWNSVMKATFEGVEPMQVDGLRMIKDGKTFLSRGIHHLNVQPGDTVNVAWEVRIDGKPFGVHV